MSTHQNDAGNPVWPTYDKGDVMIDQSDVSAATRAINSKLLFRYDRRDYAETETGKLENKLCEYFRVKHALALSSGTAALALSLLAAGIAHGDRVGCPGFAFSATPSAILMANGVPVLIEIDENLHMDINDLRSKIGSLKAVVVVHMRGFASQIKRIVALADEFGIPVIEDAVPAMGVQYEGQFVGTFGKAGAFSTQSDKSLNTGEGGFLLTNDTRLYAKAVIMSGAFENRYLKHFPGGVALDGLSDLDFPLFNFRIDEVRSALALNQLHKLDERLRRSRENYQAVSAALKEIPAIALRVPVVPDACLGDMLVFRLKEASAAQAVEFALGLNRAGIEARAFGNTDKNVRRYWDWRFLFPQKSLAEIRAILPNTTAWLDQVIDIPLSPLLANNDLARLVRVIKDLLNQDMQKGKRDESSSPI